MSGKSKAAKWWVVCFIAGAGMVYGGYFLLRYQTLPLVLTFLVLFGCYLFLLLNRRKVSEKAHFAAGFILRLLLLFAIPALSDDIYRFIWDGQLTWAGIHPFAHIPSYYAESGEFPGGLTSSVYHHLNSPDYFTVYPPVSQFFFMLMAAITGGNVFWSTVILRILIIGAETGSWFLMKNMSLQAGMDPRRISWYWLNPLVILEITGNLHLEGFMIFFCFLAFMLLFSRRFLMGGMVFGLAAGVKLLPLIFLPVIWRHIGTRSFIYFGAGAVISIVLFALPFLDPVFFHGLRDSLELYFRKFEFNASIYYLVRAAGYWNKGYNIIGTAGPYLGFLTFSAVLLYAKFHSPLKTQLTTALGITLTIYLLFATTVHPWYVLILIALMQFQHIRYPVLWSGLIVLTYTGYTVSGYSENLWLTFMEYAVVIVYMSYEIFYAGKIRQNSLYRPPVV